MITDYYDTKLAVAPAFTLDLTVPTLAVLDAGFYYSVDTSSDLLSYRLSFKGSLMSYLPT